MQGILITLATAVTVAIAAAFAAPYVVDWTAWRASFESEASRTLGVPVLIRGPIEAELLPVPKVKLHAVTVGPDAVSTGGTVERLEADFSLGALLRGNLEARVVTLSRPRARLVLDSAGRIATPTGAGAGTGLAIEQVVVDGGQIDLIDRGADRTIRLSGLSLRGEARSLSGPFRLDGEAETGGQRYGLRIALGRMEEAGARLRFIAEGRGRPLVADLDGTLRMDQGTPRFEGKGSLSRQAPAQGGAQERWRAAANVRLSPEALVADGVDLSLGDEARPVRLTGAARLSLGRALGLDAVLNARAVDADTLFSSAIGDARTPAETAAGLAGAFATLPAPDIPARIGMAVDQLTVGGTVVRDARLDLTGGPDGWRIDTAEAKLPGQSAVRLSGVPARAGAGTAFAGDLAFSSEDPPTFLRWAAPKAPSDYATAVSGPVRLAARIAAGPERFAAENIKASFGPAKATGSAAYVPGAPGRLDIALSAEGFDLDPIIAAARLALGAAGATPEGHVAIDGRNLRLSGLPVGALSLKATGGAAGWTVSKLTADDLAGLKLDGTGKFQSLSAPVNGQISLAVTGARADGLVPLARLVAGPEAADALGRLQSVAAPVKLASTATWADGGGGFSAEGTLGLVSGRLSFSRAKSGVPENILITATASDTARVLDAVGLAGLKPNQGTGHLDLTLRPAPSGEATFEGKLALPDGTATGTGTVRFAPDGALLPRIRGEVQSTDLSRVLAAVSAMDAGAVPIAATFDLSREDGRWRFEGLKGTLAGGPVSGALALEPGATPRLTGVLSVEALSVPRLIGLWGARSTGADVGNGSFSAARFSLAAAPPAVASIDLSARTIELSNAYDITDGRLKLILEAQTLEVRDLAGTIGGGHLTGALTLRRRPDVLAAEGRLALENVDATALLAPLGARTPPTGRVGLSVDLIGTGRSPLLLAQSLSGQGSFSLRALDVPGADAGAIQAVLSETNGGAPPDERRTAQMFDTALRRGPLKLDQVETAFGVVNGIVRLSPARAPAGPVRATFNGSFDMVRLLMDISLDLEAAQASGAAPGGTITWRGSAANPERRVSAAPLAATIAMLAIERETRRLEERQGLGASPSAGTSAAGSLEGAGGGTGTSTGPAAPAPETAAIPAEPPLPTPPPAPPPAPAEVAHPPAPAHQPARPAESRPSEPRSVETRRAPPLSPPREIGPGARPRLVRPDTEVMPRAPTASGFGTMQRPPGLVPGE